MQQAEIDWPCELVDFLRFNVHFAWQVLPSRNVNPSWPHRHNGPNGASSSCHTHPKQPTNSVGLWNRMDYRPAEWFVLVIRAQASSSAQARSGRAACGRGSAHLRRRGLVNGHVSSPRSHLSGLAAAHGQSAGGSCHARLVLQP